MPRLNKADNETVTANLRKTIKDMTKQMKTLEFKLAEHADEKSQTEIRGNDQVDFLKSQSEVKEQIAEGLKIEIEQKINEINEMRSEYQSQIKELKQRSMAKFGE